MLMKSFIIIIVFVIICILTLTFQSFKNLNFWFDRSRRFYKECIFCTIKSFRLMYIYILQAQFVETLYPMLFVKKNTHTHACKQKHRVFLFYIISTSSIKPGIFQTLQFHQRLDTLSAHRYKFSWHIAQFIVFSIPKPSNKYKRNFLLKRFT